MRRRISGGRVVSFGGETDVFGAGGILEGGFGEG